SSRRNVKGFRVRVAPVQVGWRLGWFDYPKMLSIRRKHPDSGWPSGIHISIPVNLHAIRNPVTRIASQIEEYFFIRQASIRLHLKAQTNLVVRLGVIEVHVLFIRRKSQPIGARQSLVN